MGLTFKRQAEGQIKTTPHPGVPKTPGAMFAGFVSSSSVWGPGSLSYLRDGQGISYLPPHTYSPNLTPKLSVLFSLSFHSYILLFYLLSTVGPDPIT